MRQEQEENFTLEWEAWFEWEATCFPLMLPTRLRPPWWKKRKSGRRGQRWVVSSKGVEIKKINNLKFLYFYFFAAHYSSLSSSPRFTLFWQSRPQTSGKHEWEALCFPLKSCFPLKCEIFLAFMPYVRHHGLYGKRKGKYNAKHKGKQKGKYTAKRSLSCIEDSFGIMQKDHCR